MKTPEYIHDTVEALRWYVSYYPKLNGMSPVGAMEDAANLIEELSKELEEVKEITETYRRRFRALKSYITNLADGVYEIKEE